MKHFGILLLALYSASLFSHPLDSLRLDSCHFYLDSQLEKSDSDSYVFADFRDVASHLGDSCTLYIAPGVYWVDDPDDPRVAVGEWMSV